MALLGIDIQEPGTGKIKLEELPVNPDWAQTEHLAHVWVQAAQVGRMEQ